MVLADSSAWIAFLRGSDSPVRRRMEALLRDEESSLRTTGPVVHEVLRGARSHAHWARLRALLARVALLPVRDPHDFEHAAAIYRALRGRGVSISQSDLLIAAVALRTGARVLELDRDFSAIAEVTALELEPI
jgi:predicted nucleic acid-binding protein